MFIKRRDMCLLLPAVGFPAVMRPGDSLTVLNWDRRNIGWFLRASIARRTISRRFFPWLSGSLDR